MVAIYQGSGAIEIILGSISPSRERLPLNQPCVYLKKKNSIRAIEIECCLSRQESRSDVLREVIVTPKPRFSIQDDIEMRCALEYVFLTSLLMMLKIHRIGAAAEEPEYQNKGTSRDSNFFILINYSENFCHHKNIFVIKFVAGLLYFQIYIYYVQNIRIHYFIRI